MTQAINWLNESQATIPTTKDYTPEYVVEQQKDKLKNFLYYHFNYGLPTKIYKDGKKPQNLIVERFCKQTHRNRDMLKIAIANKTCKLVPVDDASNKVDLVLQVIEGLSQIQDSLYNTWKLARPPKR